MGKTILKVSGFVVGIILLPVLLTMLFTGKVKETKHEQVKQVTAEQGALDQTYTVDDYLMIAMAGNIDLDMNMETLKAQAVILRTWVYEKQQESEKSGEILTLESIGLETMTLDQLKNKVSMEEYDLDIANMENAIYSTKGQVLTYGDAPIMAYFHYANNGVTRSYEQAYGEKIPYLVSVDSKKDVEAEVGVTTKVLKKAEVLKKLKEKYTLEGVTEDTLIESLLIKEKEDSGYVHTIKIAENEISGEDFRAQFNLNSTNFYFEERNGDLRIVCKGKGSGIGFSQYGGNAMAAEGKKYEELLSYYYPGTTMIHIDSMD